MSKNKKNKHSKDVSFTIENKKAKTGSLTIRIYSPSSGNKGKKKKSAVVMWQEKKKVGIRAT